VAKVSSALEYANVKCLFAAVTCLLQFTLR